jgi:hypothetical protein
MLATPPRSRNIQLSRAKVNLVATQRNSIALTLPKMKMKMRRIARGQKIGRSSRPLIMGFFFLVRAADRSESASKKKKRLILNHSWIYK